MKNTSYSVNNAHAKRGIAVFLRETFGDKPPVIACIGTDAVIGDSLGPLVGSFCEDKLKGKTFVYGTFSHPVTAMEVEPLVKFLRAVHPDVKILAVDAAVGSEEEIGTVKMSDKPLKPGAGVDKNLLSVGDANVIAVVAARSAAGSLAAVRLSGVYEAAKVIADGICDYYSQVT